MLLKGPADRLLEYLNNNPMAVFLYGQSSATEIYGVLCLKLLGCLVATLQELHGVINVDVLLSVSDIAFLMNKGGVLATTDDRYAFESSVFYIFTGANVQSKLRELMGSGKAMPIVSAPRSFVAHRSRKAWLAYYVKNFEEQSRAAKAQHAMQIALSQISVPNAFIRRVACFETSKQSKSVLQAALPEDYVRVLASSVRQWLSQRDPPTAALAQIAWRRLRQPPSPPVDDREQR